MSCVRVASLQICNNVAKLLALDGKVLVVDKVRSQVCTEIVAEVFLFKVSFCSKEGIRIFATREVLKREVFN